MRLTMALLRKVLKLLSIAGLLSATAQQNGSDLDPVRDQLELYKEKTEGLHQQMTLSSGAPIEYRDTTSFNQQLLYNNYFMEVITGIARERIPARPVHGKGAGAFGYFEVTSNVTQYTKADFLNEVGKKTPVVVRFSPSTADPTGSDSARLFRGFAVKFYTKQGNFDMVGLNLPIFAINDPILFPSITHALSRSPVTHIEDTTAMWDFISLHPETFFMFSKIFSNTGIPKGYRHMTGYGIHTFQIQNKFGQIYLARFYFTPDAGEASLSTEEGSKLDGKDPDSFTRDLYNAIACGKKVSWTFSMQLMTVEQANQLDINVFDITQDIPIDKVPLTEVGKLVLDRNPENYFAQVEQLAFCPCHLVPGIDGGVDTTFRARMFSYRDAQNYRLGVNHNNIEVNCPFMSEPHTYLRDGVPPLRDNGKDSPNYYKNSFNGPQPYHDEDRSNLITVLDKKSDNYGQACENYLAMSMEEKKSFNKNLVDNLGPVVTSVQERIIKLLQEICPAMAKEVEKGLREFEKQPACDVMFD